MGALAAPAAIAVSAAGTAATAYGAYQSYRLAKEQQYAAELQAANEASRIYEEARARLAHYRAIAAGAGVDPYAGSGAAIERAAIEQAARRARAVLLIGRMQARAYQDAARAALAQGSLEAATRALGTYQRYRNYRARAGGGK